ncbi:site-specific DNA-methyltransferase [Kitasatospora sp. NBC_01287]|uniref:hypothetical protein n=1 Tax=Kitasatospora sp. NBC_01287 TaxID=2903573 RepID=UPI002259DAE8|nr:hypothetical protein [Kitasatospora sp. NBC_01287]MCX4744611.1 site-specific DNA-methyltransferase [Kitasatospora sp. NBC_01287]
MEHSVRAYGIPGCTAEYLPDPDEPIGRWFTMPNTGNSQAVAKTVLDLSPVAPTVLIDPFCGAGSGCLAARHLGIPFIGAEVDPVLACVSTAKALCGPAEGEALLRPPEGREGVALRCLRFVHRLQGAAGGGSLSERQLADDLVRGPALPPGSAVVHGDATDPHSWDGLPVPADGVVVFTSPPFYDAWAGPEVPAGLRSEARAALAARHPSGDGDPGAGTGTTPGPTPRGYGDLVVGALRAIRTAAPHATAIIEHEPGSSTGDRLPAVAERIVGEVGAESVEILRVGTFSAGGPLSLLVCRF